MSCTRCHGLMVNEHLIDMEASIGEMWACTRRCVNCGHRDDAVIQQHRQARPNSHGGRLAGVVVQAEPRVVYQPDVVHPLAA